MVQLQELIASVRAARKDLGVEEKAQVPVRIRTNDATQQLFAANAQIVERLARVSSLEFVASNLDGSGIRSTPQFDVQVVYERTIDVAAERERLNKERARLEKEQANAERQLGNEGFLAKAPTHIVDGLRKKSIEVAELIEKTRAALEELG